MSSVTEHRHADRAARGRRYRELAAHRRLHAALGAAAVGRRRCRQPRHDHHDLVVAVTRPPWSSPGHSPARPKSRVRRPPDPPHWDCGSSGMAVTSVSGRRTSPHRWPVRPEQDSTCDQDRASTDATVLPGRTHAIAVPYLTNAGAHHQRRTGARRLRRPELRRDHDARSPDQLGATVQTWGNTAARQPDHRHRRGTTTTPAPSQARPSHLRRLVPRAPFQGRRSPGTQPLGIPWGQFTRADARWDEPDGQSRPSRRTVTTPERSRSPQKPLNSTSTKVIDRHARQCFGSARPPARRRRRAAYLV